MSKVLLRNCIISFLFILSCLNKAGTPVPQQAKVIYVPPKVSASFIKGADISWVTQMEASGYKFYDKSGMQQIFCHHEKYRV